MGKYGSGVSMKDAITSEVDHIKGILEKNSLPEEDKEEIIGALKEMAYQWCNSNASACSVETELLKIFTPDEYANFVNRTIHNGMHKKVLMDTYPYISEGV